jgi:replicative DNA helicase
MNGGIATGELCSMLARTGVGKTWFGLNVLNNNPLVPAIFFSLEMHARYILQRLAGLHTNTPTSAIESALFEGGESPEIEMTLDDFPYLAIVDQPGMSIPMMEEACEQYEAFIGTRPKLVVIDYAELVVAGHGEGSARADDLWVALKNFSREADVAAVVLHQVGRYAGTTKKGEVNEGHLPLRKSDGRYSGENQVDYMFGMYKPGLDPEQPGDLSDLRLQFLKTRTDGQITRRGVQHYVDVASGRISELRGVI